MISLFLLEQALNSYEKCRVSVYTSPLDLSGVYALFPETDNGVSVAFRWPEKFPHAGKPGVYFIFSAQMSLLYIGSTTSDLNGRLGNYFGYVSGRSGPCRIKEMQPPWKTPPCYVRTIAVERPEEAPVLESYLIDSLQPPDNTKGIRRA